MQRLCRFVFALGVCALMFGASRPAAAQPGRGMMGNFDEPTINSKEIERYAEILRMSPDQVENAKGMLEGFNTEFNSLRQEMRQAFESMRDEARDTGDNGVWRNAGTLMQTFQKKIEKAEKQYFDDMKLLLTDDQAARWPVVERARRREKSVPRGGLVSGEGVDLVRIVNELKLTAEESQPVQPLLEQYENDLDRALAERDKAYEEGMGQGANLWFNQQMDKIDELFNKARDAAAKVKDVNKRYARQIEGALPEAYHAKFESEVQKASFPRVYRPSYAARAITAAEGITDLSDEQKTQLAQIRDSFEKSLAPIQQKQADSIEQTEMNRTAMQMFGMGGGGNEGSAELRDLRREVEDGTYEKVRDLLTEEQRAKLPERPQRGDWRRLVPGGGNGGGGERPRRPGNAS